jgi:hypothetical protein
LDIDPYTLYTNATVLYLSTVPGAFTNVPPTQPNHRVVLGRVERNQSSGGGDIIHVQIDIGDHLEYLHDVNVAGATSNDLLLYNGTVWTNWARTNLSGIYLPLAGGTMSGSIDMNEDDITSVNLIQLNSIVNQSGDEIISISGKSIAPAFTFDNNLTVVGTMTASTVSLDRVKSDNNAKYIDFNTGEIISSTSPWEFDDQPIIPGYATDSELAAVSNAISNQHRIRSRMEQLRGNQRRQHERKQHYKHFWHRPI